MHDRQARYKERQQRQGQTRKVLLCVFVLSMAVWAALVSLLLP